MKYLLIILILTFALVQGIQSTADDFRELDRMEYLVDDSDGEEKKDFEDTSFVRVLLDSDVVHLLDGTTIEGTIIVVAAKSAILLTEDGEQVIPREEIEKIVRAKDRVSPTTLPVRSVDGYRFIVMEPVDTEAAKQASPGAERDTPARAQQNDRITEEPRPESIRKLTTEELTKELERGSLDALLELMERAAEDSSLLQKLDEQFGPKQ